MPFNPGTGPYNYPQITISQPLTPPPVVMTNVSTLLQTNAAGILILVNGLLMTNGADYTRNGSIVTFVAPPGAGATIMASVFQIGRQLGGVNPLRYVAPIKLPLLPINGSTTIYGIEVGPTISGVTDGVNNLFVTSVWTRRMRIWRNGILQTVLQDVTTGPNAIVFLPDAIPQPGDIILAEGFV